MSLISERLSVTYWRDDAGRFPQCHVARRAYRPKRKPLLKPFLNIAVKGSAARSEDLG
jgi:hypothetical protein